MKKFALVVIVGFCSISLFAQDSITSPKFLLRPYFENGIDFIRNESIKQNYETQSNYYWGFGLQLGLPDFQKVIPYVQFTYSNYEIEEEISQNIFADSSYTNKQISGGVIVPIKKVDDIFFRSRIGYSYSMIKESFNRIDSNSHGFQVGIGAEKNVCKNSRLYIDLIYNYQKTNNSSFKDFDVTKLSIGFVL